MRYCPECKTELNADDHIYVSDGVITGCEHCTQTMFADELLDFEEDLEEKAKDEYENFLWSVEQERKAGVEW